MLPIRFACSGLVSRLLGLTLLVVLGGAILGPVRAVPLLTQGVEDFRTLLKREPKPEAAEAGVTLAEYRHKLRQAAKDLPSLGEVARVLLLAEWSLTEEVDPSVPEDQVKKAVRETEDSAFKRDVQQLMAKTDDLGAVNTAIVGEIKRDVRRQLLDRLQKRTRFYLLEGRTVDRIAAANLIRDTMSNSRRQDVSMYHDEKSGAVIPGVMATRSEDIAPGSGPLRESFRELSGDLIKLTEAPDPQVRAAAIHALSDLEINPAALVAVYKPLLTSGQSDVITRKATAEALAHTLEVSAVRMDKSRPLPYLRGLRLILPVAAAGLSDDDAGVRRASLEACARATQIFDDLASDALSVSERRIVFQPALAVLEEILPKINEAARDRVPAFRVAACHVLESLVLAMHKLQRYNEVPAPKSEPSKPNSLPSPENDKYKKKVTLPPHPSGRRRTAAGPSQWATARLQPQPSLPLPPVPLTGDTTAAEVTLDRPIKLPASPMTDSSRRPAAPLVRAAAFLAPQLDQLPPPAPVESGIPETVRTLMDNLKHPDYRVRLAAVDALETLGNGAVPAIPALVTALRDSNKFVRWGSVRALGRLNPRQADEVVPGLMRVLDDREDPSVRIAALKALEQYGEHAKKAVPVLARVINRGDKEYIIAMLRTIQGIGTDAAPTLPNVAWILSDRSHPPSVRIEAAQTLGRFGALAREQLPVLRDVMTNESDEDVRNAASTAVLAVDRPEK